MTRTNKILTRIAAAVVLVGGVVALTAAGKPTVTLDQLQPAIAQTFTNLYVLQAQIQGTPGVTATSVHASAACDRGGPAVADVGPGANWICMITYTDNTGTVQNGKFELQIRPNCTYVANGPSKLIGSYTITDHVTGQQVPNPVFQFDGAFAPAH
jgi:hypothetical protein